MGWALPTVQQLKASIDSKHFIARNPRVLNGYSYQVFSLIAAQSGPHYDPGFDVLTAFFNIEGMPPVSDVDISGKTDDGRQLKRVNTLKSQLFWFIFVEFYPETDVNRV